MVYTHCLAGTCIAFLIDATYKDRTGERYVEAEVDQHVPELAAHTDRPEGNGHTIHNHRMNTERCESCITWYNSVINSTLHTTLLVIHQFAATSDHN